MDQLAIGIDLGGTKIKGVLIDDAGKRSEGIEKPTEDSSDSAGEPWKQAIYDMVQELRSRSKKNIKAIGLAAPGIADKKNERIVCMPGRLEGLEHLRWADFLGVNEIPVKIINDTQAALMAESVFGAGKEYKNIVMLTLGTGIGGGILINGELYQGNFQRAGHVGHISLDADGHRGITNIPGSLEEAIGNASLERRSMGKFGSTVELIAAYENGDYFATYLWLNSVRKLSIGIASLINVIAPDVVILGGGITKAGEALFKPLGQFMDLYEWRPGGVKTPIKKASFQTYAGAIGAAGFTLSSLGKETEHRSS